MNWTSQTFAIPVDHVHEMPYSWSICRKFSLFYCLEAFETEYEGQLQALNSFGNSVFVSYQYYFHLETRAIRACASKLKQIDLRHNLYSDTTGDCHFRLCFSYFNMGFRNSLLTVDEYIAKLTNYIDEDKNLNSIWSFYDPACRVNVIAKLGFGTGSLRKYSNLRGGRYRSFPYQMKIGLRWSDPIPAKKLKQVITYSWFKQNVICSSQPWICNDSG